MLNLLCLLAEIAVGIIVKSACMAGILWLAYWYLQGQYALPAVDYRTFAVVCWAGVMLKSFSLTITKS